VALLALGVRNVALLALDVRNVALLALGVRNVALLALGVTNVALLALGVRLAVGGDRFRGVTALRAFTPFGFLGEPFGV
jgi:hypothetical protein